MVTKVVSALVRLFARRRAGKPAVGYGGGVARPYHPEPVGVVELWAIDGATADPDEWDSAVMLRYYGTHEVHQAIRDANRARPFDHPRASELRVVDATGAVLFRAFAGGSEVAA